MVKRRRRMVRRRLEGPRGEAFPGDVRGFLGRRGRHETRKPHMVGALGAVVSAGVITLAMLLAPDRLFAASRATAMVADETSPAFLLGRLLKPGATLLEVGAGVGAHALFLAAAIGPAGHLFLYESRPLQQRVLRQNLGANRVGNVTLMTGTLGRAAEAHVGHSAGRGISH